MDGIIQLWQRVIISAIEDFVAKANTSDRWLNRDFVTAIQFIFDDSYKINFDAVKCIYCDTQREDYIKTIISDKTESLLDRHCKRCHGNGWYITDSCRDINFRELIELCAAASRASGCEFDLPCNSVDDLRKKLLAKFPLDAIIIEDLLLNE